MPSPLKETIHHALESNDLAAVVSLAKESRKAVSLLVRLAYEKETLLGWRAIKAIGLVARELVDTNQEFLRETIRRLLWSLSDESGGIGWAAPEILGEIVSADPVELGDIIPLIAEVYDAEEVFRPGVVYALTRIAETDPRLVASYQKITMMSLAAKNPLAKIYALDLVKRVWHTATREKLWSDEYCSRIAAMIDHLVSDHGVAWVYYDNGFSGIEVGESAQILQKNIECAL